MDYAAVEAKTIQLANQMIAERAKVDLFYLASYILGGENVLDPKVHGPLCRALRPLIFYQNPEAIEGVEFPSDYGRTDEEGMPSEEEKQEFLEWLEQFKPDASTGAIEDKVNMQVNKILSLMPRGTLKSTVITVAFPIQFYLNFPNSRTLLVSETFTKAKAFLGEIKDHYEKNHKLRAVYGTIYKNEDGSPMTPDQNEKSDTWSTEQLNLSARSRPLKEGTIECAGIGVTKNGMHYDLIIADDLHSELNTREKEQIDKVKEYFKLLFSLLEPGACLVTVGTRWDDDDLYQMIIDDYSDMFNFITRMAETDDGKLFYPSRLDRKTLDGFRRVQGASMYSCQYLNNPIDSDSADFKQDMFKHVSRDEAAQIPMNLYGMVDPSYAGKYGSSDYAAFVVGGMGPGGEIYARYCHQDKMKYAQIFDKMASIQDQWPEIRFWWVEAIGTKSLEDDFDRMNRQRALNGLRPLDIRYNRTQRLSKEDRIRALIPYYQRGDVYHVVGGGMIDVLEGQLRRFPRAKNDDMMDAWSGILRIATPSRMKMSEEDYQKRQRRSKILNKPRSPMTGY